MYNLPEGFELALPFPNVYDMKIWMLSILSLCILVNGQANRDYILQPSAGTIIPVGAAYEILVIHIS